MKNKLSTISITVLIGLFLIFYFVTTLILDNVKHNEEIKDNNSSVVEKNSRNDDEKKIVDNLYQNVRILYDVVNNKFKVSQDDVIVVNDITYKKIVNFDSVVFDLFTSNGVSKYISDLGSYFVYLNDQYYLAGNLVSYQTYYFRGDNTNIYVLDANDTSINAIIYEKWTSNNKNTLATIKVVKENDVWLIDDISILDYE